MFGIIITIVIVLILLIIVLNNKTIKEREQKITESINREETGSFDKHLITLAKEPHEQQQSTNLASDGYVTVSVKSLEKYNEGARLDEDIFWESMDEKTITIHSSRIADMDRRLAEYKAKVKKLHKCAELNNKGIEYEKNGELKLAIKTYEKNIITDCYPAHHSFKRLMVLYRKEKDYENEHRVILRALEVFPDWQEYIDRLHKVEKLTNKICFSPN
jgi:tetratricopeptide (TPR) repeat protein